MMGDVTKFPGKNSGKKGGNGPGRPPTGNSGEKLISLNALAQLIGVNRSVIERWAKEDSCPTVTRPNDGNNQGWTFNIPDVWAWRERSVREAAIAAALSNVGPVDGEFLDFDDRWKRGRAIEKELNVGVLQGALVFDVDVAKLRDREIGRFGQEANSIPAKAARDINPKDQQRIQNILQKYVDAMLERLIEGDDDEEDDDE